MLSVRTSDRLYQSRMSSKDCQAVFIEGVNTKYGNSSTTIAFKAVIRQTGIASDRSQVNFIPMTQAVRNPLLQSSLKPVRDLLRLVLSLRQ